MPRSAQSAAKTLETAFGECSASSASLLIALGQSFPFEPWQIRQFFFAALIVGVTLIVLRTLFRSAWETFAGYSDLLLPIGVVTLASTTLELLVLVPSLHFVLTPSLSKVVYGLSLALSVKTVLRMIVWTAYAAWKTDLLWRRLQATSRLTWHRGLRFGNISFVHSAFWRLVWAFCWPALSRRWRSVPQPLCLGCWRWAGSELSGICARSLCCRSQFRVGFTGCRQFAKELCLAGR